MSIGFPTDLTWYQLFVDQGNIVAGLLALLAGVGAVIITWRAGVWQRIALETQNAELRRQARVGLAREGIVTVRMISGVIACAGDGIRKLDGMLAQVTYHQPKPAEPEPIGFV
jgi:hypothetical protein